MNGWTRLALVTLAAGCGSETAAPPVVPPLAVAVSPRSAMVYACVSTRLTALVSGGGEDAARSVTWLSRDPAIIAVDEAGLLTAMGEGDTWILARAVADPQVADSAFATTRQLSTTPTVTLHIERITTGPDSADVSPDSVAGSVDVMLVADGIGPCSELERVELRVDGAVVGTRPAQATSFTRVLPLDTRALDPLTGAPRWPDGPHRVNGVLVNGDGQIVSTPFVTLTFRNGVPP